MRLIAATNRDLGKMIADREFRSDLYYRLNVFPIRIPPLRERREDIPLLARYFAQKFAQQMQKRIETIPTVHMKALSDWDWPGNVRELANFIERAVILTRGNSLQVPVAELRGVAPVRIDAEHEFGLMNLRRQRHLNAGMRLRALCKKQSTRSIAENVLPMNMPRTSTRKSCAR